MNKKYIFTTALGVAALATPLTAVALTSNYSKNSTVRQVVKDSVWNPKSVLNQNSLFTSQEVKDALVSQKQYGEYTAWTTKTLLSGATIRAIAPDAKGGFVIGGDAGKFDHISASGDLEASWVTKTLLGGKVINVITPVADGFLVAGQDGAFDHINSKGDSIIGGTKTLIVNKQVNVIVPDEQGNFLIGGAGGALDHIDDQGNILANWTTKTLLNGKEIKTIVSDNKGGFFVGGTDGSLDHLDSDLNVMASMTLLGNADINSIVFDGQGNFLVGGKGGQIDKIDASGALVSNWTTKTLFSNKSITTLVSNGNGGFFATSDDGQLANLDANGDVLAGWNSKTLLDGKKVNAIAFDGVGGFFTGGDDGKFDHIDSNGLRLKFDSWEINYDEEEAKYGIYENMLQKDWSTAVDLGFGLAHAPVTSDGHGNFYVLDNKNIVHKIANDGTQVSGFTPITVFSSADISFVSVIPDSNGGFVAVGRNGNSDSARSIALVHVDAQGTLTDWTTNVSQEKSYGFAIAPDGNGGYWVGGNTWNHIDAQGKKTNGPQDIGVNFDAYCALSDGQGGVVLGGSGSSISKISSDGKVTAITTSLKGEFYDMNFNGQGGTLIGNDYGQIENIDAMGQSVPNWSLTSLSDKTINAISPVGDGEFLFGDKNGNVARIDANGNLVTGSNHQLTSGKAISSIVPDGQGDFFVFSEDGTMGHIDADGNITKAETKDETLKRWRSQQIAPPLEDKDFAFTNNAGNISVNYTKHLPNAVILEYSDDNGVTWKPSVDQLVSGQAILVHQKLANNVAKYFQIENDVTLSLVTPKKYLLDALDATDFTIGGLRENATVALNKPGLSPFLDVEYSVDGGTNWSKNIKVSLKQNDVIKARLCFKNKNSENNYDIVNKAPFVDLKIDVPLIKINDQISQKDFAFSDDSDGKIDVALTKQLSPLLKVVYSSDGTKWSDTLPTNLKYGDKVESKLDFASASSSRDYDLVNASVVKLEVVKPAAKFPIWGWILLAISGAFLFVGLALLLKKFALSPRLA